MHVTYNASNNRQSGDSADANGNILYNGSSSTIYDLDNRMVQPGGTAVDYAYDAGNKRVWKGDTSQNPVLDEVDFWAGNQKLATYQIYTYNNGGHQQLSYNLTTTRVYFGGKLVSQGTYSSTYRTLTLGPVAQDRLGSIGKFYPYGQERPSATQNDTEKFTGYYRDASTGLDYADQRYHQDGVGRFITPDQATGNLQDPSAWNKYAYVGGDPINRKDPTGQWWIALGPDATDWIIQAPGADDPSSGGNQGYFGSIITGAIAAAVDSLLAYQQPQQQACSVTTGQYRNYVCLRPADPLSSLGATVIGDLNWLSEYIDPECAHWLETGMNYPTGEDIYDYIQGLHVGQAGFESLGPAPVPDTFVVAISGPNGDAGYDILVNDYAKLSNMPVFDQIQTLLHELGHLTEAEGMDPNDDTNKTSGRNNDVVRTHCAQTLGYFSPRIAPRPRRPPR